MGQASFLKPDMLAGSPKPNLVDSIKTSRQLVKMAKATTHIWPMTTKTPSNHHWKSFGKQHQARAGGNSSIDSIMSESEMFAKMQPTKSRTCIVTSKEQWNTHTGLHRKQSVCHLETMELGSSRWKEQSICPCH